MDLWELEQLASQRLDRGAYDYYAGGADDELTLADNLAAWNRLCLRPHVLRDVSAVDTSATVLGTPLPSPVLVAPMAFQRLAHDEGEKATARGSAAAGTIMITSTAANVSLEDVAKAAPDGVRWFQLYAQVDRDLTVQVVTRAAAAGYRALVLTVDVPLLGIRRRDIRNSFALPEGLEMANLGRSTPDTIGSSVQADADAQFDASLTFDDIGWLAELSGLPVVVKGVLRGDDARACVDAGAVAVVVSNHGARQLDTSVASADALAEVAGAVGGEAEVYVDGGIRRGTDVIKARALGARAVLLGRPVLWGLATGGADGVTSVLAELRGQLERALALCGCPSLDDVTPDLLARP